MGDLCAAAIEYSDNGAANLILASLRGRTHGRGDALCALAAIEITRLDHTEPALNRPAARLATPPRRARWSGSGANFY